MDNTNGRAIGSTPKPQEITIKCENEIEDKIILDKTGKLSVNKKCTIITPHVTLHRKGNKS